MDIQCLLAHVLHNDWTLVGIVRNYYKVNMPSSSWFEKKKVRPLKCQSLSYGWIGCATIMDLFLGVSDAIREIPPFPRFEKQVEGDCLIVDNNE